MSHEVYVHAGAPRSGSSALQMFLDVNAEAIRAQGFSPVYPGRDGAAGGRLRFRVPGPRDGPRRQATLLRQTRASLARMAAPGGPMILSEENLCGRMRPLFSGRFFADAGHRARYLTQVLEGRPVARLTLVLRPYDAMFASAFRKMASLRQQMPFEDAAANMAAMQAGWPGVIRDMIEGLDPGEVRLLRYRRRSQAEIAAEICPALDTSGLAEHVAPVNPSLSDAALAALQAAFRAGRGETEAERAEIARAAGAEAPPAPFAAFDPETAGRLRARFEDDLETLAGFDRVTIA